MVYPALLPLMRTARLSVVDWPDAPADLNGLVRCAERRNLVSARVPSHFKRSLPLRSLPHVTHIRWPLAGCHSFPDLWPRRPITQPGVTPAPPSTTQASLLLLLIHRSWEVSCRVYRLDMTLQSGLDSNTWKSKLACSRQLFLVFQFLQKPTNPETAASDGVGKLLTYEPTAHDESWIWEFSMLWNFNTFSTTFYSIQNAPVFFLSPPFSRSFRSIFCRNLKSPCMFWTTLSTTYFLSTFCKIRHAPVFFPTP